MSERVPQESIHQVLKEGNMAPPELVEFLKKFEEREPLAPHGQRIALGLTLLREIDAKVALRWMQLLRSHWFPGPTYNGRGQYTVQARNLVLHQAFQELDAWDRLLFWDADQVPPLFIPAIPHIGWQGGYFTEYIQWLAANHSKTKPIIGGLYFSREDYWQTDIQGRVKAGPHEPVAYWGNEEDGTYRYLSLPELGPMLERRGLHRVKGLGTGAMLIDKKALLDLAELKAPAAIFQGPESLKRELFERAIVDTDSAEREEARHTLRLLLNTGGIFEAPDLRPGQKGGASGTQWTEDLYFCHEMQTKLGHWIWLDTAMESAHVAEIWITSAHYLESRGIATTPHQNSLKRVGQEPQPPQGEKPRTSRIVLPR